MPERLATFTGRLRTVPRPAVRMPTFGSRRPTAGALAVAVFVALAALTGVVAATSDKIGLAVAAAILVFAIFVADPVLLAVIALPASLLLVRVGGASTNLSTADLVVFVAGLACLTQIRWREAKYLKQFLQGIVWYEAVLLLVVVVNPNHYDVIDWFHRWSFIGASVLVGWTLASHARLRPAFRALLYGAAFLGIVAMLDALATHLQPAQFGLYQKNAIGDIMWVAIVVAQINPPWLGIGRREARVCKYLCIGGLLASYSRQGVIALIIALVVAGLRNPEVRRRSKMMMLGAVPLVVALYYSFSYAAHHNPQFNSVSIRVSQLSAAFHVWHLSPLFGEGMRFYNLPQFVSVTAPPNVLVDNLASTGIVGSLAFFYLVYVTTRTMLRLPALFGTLGLAILVSHYIDGLFDIFWIGASSTIPFIICGACLGMADRVRTRGEPDWTAARNGRDADGAGRSPPAPAREPGEASSRWNGPGTAARVRARSSPRRGPGFLPG